MTTISAVSSDENVYGMNGTKPRSEAQIEPLFEEAKGASAQAQTIPEQETKEPQFINKYGKTKLPEGSVLLREQTQYSYGRNYMDPHFNEPCLDQARVGVVLLPNGVEVTIQKNSYYGNGEITIEQDGTVLFNNVQYTTIIGTDGDDKFKFKNNPNMDYIDKYIQTRRGNDTVVDPSSHGSKSQYGHVTVVADGNLKVIGNPWNVEFRVNGELDATRAAGKLHNWQFEPISGATNIDVKM